jgi:hypothetical protein
MKIPDKIPRKIGKMGIITVTINRFALHKLKIMREFFFDIFISGVILIIFVSEGNM